MPTKWIAHTSLLIIAMLTKHCSTTSQYHSCKISNVSDSIKIKCWGNNLVGELGTGDTDRRGDGK